MPTHRASQDCSSSHVWMWELDNKKGWAPKNRCLQFVVLGKTLESVLDSKEIKQSILKEINSEYSLERLMLKLKLQYFGHLMWRSWLENTLMLDWEQEEKGMTEAEMVGWYHWYNGHEFKQTPKTVKDREAWQLQFMGSQRVGHNLVTEQQHLPS